MSHLVGIVTARALRYGLETGPRSDSAARELGGLADRSSRVGERAREALEQALVLGAAGVRPMTTSSSEMEARWAGPGD